MPGFTSAQLQKLIKLESYYFKNSGRSSHSLETQKHHEQITTFICQNLGDEKSIENERHQSNIRCQIQRYFRYLSQARIQAKNTESTLSAYSKKENLLHVLANLIALLAYFKAPDEEKKNTFQDIALRAKHRTMKTLIGTIADEKASIVHQLKIKESVVKDMTALKADLLKTLNLPDYNCAIHVFTIIQKSMTGLYHELIANNSSQMWKLLLCLALEFQELAERLHYDSLLYRYLPEIEDFKINLIGLFQHGFSEQNNQQHSIAAKEVFLSLEKNSIAQPKKQSSFDFSNLKQLIQDNSDQFFQNIDPVRVEINNYFEIVLSSTKAYSHLSPHYLGCFQQLCQLHAQLTLYEIDMLLNRREQQQKVLSKDTITKLLEREVQVLVDLSEIYKRLASIHSTATPSDRQFHNLFAGKASTAYLQAAIQQNTAHNTSVSSTKSIMLLPLKDITLLMNTTDQLLRTEPGNVQLYREVLLHHLRKLKEPDFINSLTRPERITHFHNLIKIAALLTSSNQFALYHDKKAAELYFEEYTKYITDSYAYFSNSKTPIERHMVVLKQIHLPKQMLESDFITCCQQFHSTFLLALNPLNPLQLIESLDTFCLEISMVFGITEFGRLVTQFENIIAQYLLYIKISEVHDWHNAMSSIAMQNFRLDLTIFFNSPKEVSSALDNQAAKQNVTLCMKNTSQLLIVLANQITKHLILKNSIPDQELNLDNRLLFKTEANVSPKMRKALETIAQNNDQARFHFLRPQPRNETSILGSSSATRSDLRTQSDSTHPQMLRRTLSDRHGEILSHRETVAVQEAQDRLRREQSDGFVDVDLNN